MEDTRPGGDWRPTLPAKPPRKTGRIVGLCILVGLLVAALVIGIWWWGHPRQPALGSVDLAGAPVRRELSAPAADVQAIDADLTLEDLVLEQSTGDEIQVRQVAPDSASEDELAGMRMDGSTLVVRSGYRAESQGFWWNFFGPSFRSRITISIPASYTGTLDTQSSSGDVEADGIHAGAVSLGTSSGDVTATGLECGQLAIGSSSGGQKLRSTACAALSMDSSSGDMEVEDVAAADTAISRTSGNLDAQDLACGNLEVSSSSGDTEMEAVACESLSARSTSGKLEMKAVADGACRLETSSGDIRFEGEALALQMVSTSGCQEARLVRPESVEASSSSGDQRIEVADTSVLSEVRCDATSGDVTVRLPEGSSISLEHNALAGDLDLADADKFTLAENGVKVYITTSSGDAKLEKI